MKRLMLICGLVTAMVLMAGCATGGGSGGVTGSTPTAAQQLTPQQVVAIVCQPMQSALTQLSAIYATQAALGNAKAAVAEAGLAKATPIVSEACSVGAEVSTANVQDFVSTALPALAQVAGSLPLSSSQMQNVQTALLTAQVALGVYNVVQSQIAVGSGTASSAPATSSSVK